MVYIFLERPHLTAHSSAEPVLATTVQGLPTELAPKYLPKMTNKSRRRCRSTYSKRPQPAAVGTRALLPFRRSNVQGLVWLGVSAAVASTLLSRVEAFLQPLAGGMGGSVGFKGHRSARRERAAAQGVCSMSERRGLWPSRPTIDLRSDTVTQPTGGMRKAMHKVLYYCCCAVLCADLDYPKNTTTDQCL